MAIPISGMPNWEELTRDVADVDRITRALALVQSTFPGRYNYEKLTTPMLLHKMVPRRCHQGPWVEGLRIFHRLIPGQSPQIDIAVMFFLRLKCNNTQLEDAYCLTGGTNGDSGITGPQLHSDVFALCNHVRNSSAIRQFEIVNAASLPGDFPSLPQAQRCRAAFEDALAGADQTPSSGQLGPPTDIVTGGGPMPSAWPARMKSWRVTF